VNHKDHIDLLRKGVGAHGGRWADLGCGSGAFTPALAELLGTDGVILAVDRDLPALERLRSAAHRRLPDHNIHILAADFTGPLHFPPLDGVVMANSLHFHQDKARILRRVKRLLREQGRIIVVEYNVDRGNAWVPFPISYPRWERLAAECGFSRTDRIGTKPSSFLREMYSAVSY
jgi:SAM-dependent methyltransferase